MSAVELKQLRKTYANGIEAVKGIDLTVNKGDFFALLGVNGAGKSTTIGLITTLVRKTSGTITICGYDSDTFSGIAKSCIGLVPQEMTLNVFENVQQVLINQAGFYGIAYRQAKNRAHELLQQLGLWEKRNSIVRQLSGGMKRRLMMARALVHQPKVLILDEPTAGVDIEIRRSMWEFLTETNASGTTIILTTHYLEEAEQLCKNIAIIDHGKIIKNTSMQALINTIGHQTYVFNTQKPISELPALSPFSATLVDTNTFELKVDNNIALNEVFALLSEQQLAIHSFRNKNNRLEALFLDLINHDH